jgi:hypothetical protein
METIITGEFLKWVVASLIIVIGWGVVHYLAEQRDVKNKKREIITGYLIEAYRNIEDGCGRGPQLTEDRKRKMEKAIADIQLFGSKDRVEVTKRFTETMNKDSYADPRDLLIDLRNELRKELELETASSSPEDIIHWRLK